MRMIILAAGRGERLLPLTKNTPKPLLDLGNGNTLLEEQIERIAKSGVIDRVSLVVGYLAEQIEAKLKVFRKQIPLTTVYNPFYDVSNNLVSLWMARYELLEEDCIVTNGDNLFSPDVFEGLVKNNSQDGIYVTTMEKNEFTEDDMKVTLENGEIQRISKQIEPANAHAESVGLILIRGQKFRRLLREHLEMLVREKQNLGIFWLEAFNSMHRNGIRIFPWMISGENCWQEFDFHLDISNARTIIASKMTRAASAGLK